MAETRSSSAPEGSADAMISPSTLTTADAVISGAPLCNSRRRSTINSVRDFAMPYAPSWCALWSVEHRVRLLQIACMIAYGPRLVNTARRLCVALLWDED